MTLEHGGDQCLIRLVGAIDITQAAELKTMLMEAIQQEKPIRVLLEGVTRLDITVVQLLWAAEREARLAGREFGLASEVPETVRAALRSAGLDGFPLC